MICVLDLGGIVRQTPLVGLTAVSGAGISRDLRAFVWRPLLPSPVSWYVGLRHGLRAPSIRPAAFLIVP